MRDHRSVLDRIEPDTIPSRRYNRIVQIGRARVLEMRDPNSGLGGGPETKPRHQYLRAGGLLWSRRLPRETVGDAWMLRPGDDDPARWALCEPRGLIAEWTAAESGRPECAVALLVRLRTYAGDDEAYYCIRGESVATEEADDVAIIYGPITGSWWDVPLPPCPDCGGDVVWWEAGYVPGVRKCLGRPIRRDADGTPAYDVAGGCGSLYSIESRS